MDILFIVFFKIIENINYYYFFWLKILMKMFMINDLVSKRKINYRFDLKVCRLYLKIVDIVVIF